jgi:hydroxymethylbilane synthase
MPLAAHAVFESDALYLRAAWGDPEGGRAVVRVEGKSPVHTLEEAVALGEEVAKQLQAAVTHAR